MGQRRCAATLCRGAGGRSREVVQAWGSIAAAEGGWSQVGRLARVWVVLLGGGHRDGVTEVLFVTLAVRGWQEWGVFVPWILENELQRGYFACLVTQTLEGL